MARTDFVWRVIFRPENGSDTYARLATSEEGRDRLVASLRRNGGEIVAVRRRQMVGEWEVAPIPGGERREPTTPQPAPPIVGDPAEPAAADTGPAASAGQPAADIVAADIKPADQPGAIRRSPFRTADSTNRHGLRKL